MARTSVATYETSAPVPLPPGLSGAAEARSYFAGDDAPLRLHVLGLARGDTLRLEPSGIDRLAYIRHGIGDLRDLVTNDLRFLEQF